MVPLLFVTGKGGVGKSTVAAALALREAAAGERVALVALGDHPYQHFFPGLSPVTYRGTAVMPHLTIRQITPREAFEEYAVLRLGSRRLYHLVFDNRFVHYFLDATPGLSALMGLGKLWHMLTQEKAFTRIIVDLPATGHGVGLLTVPRLLIRSMSRGPLVGLGETLQQMLRDPSQCAALVVSLCEELPVQETVELVHRLRTDVGIALAGLVANRVPAMPLAAVLHDRWTTEQVRWRDDAVWGTAARATAFLMAAAERAAAHEATLAAIPDVLLLRLAEQGHAGPAAVLHAMQPTLQEWEL